MRIVPLSTTSDWLEPTIDLFDQYRQFYRQRSDLPAARTFVHARMANQESVIFVAIDPPQALGFVQLYPSFTSVGMRRSYVLNDLFVAGSARSRGVAQALIQHSEQYARQQGAHHLVLETEVSNTRAQSLYEHMGWIKDTDHIHYGRLLDTPIG
ncbi:MAG: GNAT family N-acetyltransferase [Pseudomonadota bacterium]